MPNLDRSLIIRGPALLQWKGCPIYTKDSIVLKSTAETFDVETSLEGKVDERTRNRKVEVTLTPSGMLDSSLLSVLFPYASLPVGSSVFAHASQPSQDNPLVILTAAGRKITFHAAAVTKMPRLTLAATKTALGSMTFTCIRKNSMETAAPGSFYQIETQAWSDPGTFDRSKVRTGSYLGDWAAAGPWHNFETMDGWQVDFELTLKPVETDGAGLVDMTLAGLEVTATSKPLPLFGGIDEQALLEGLSLQGPDGARGASLGALASTHDLVIRHGASPNLFTLTLARAALKEGGLRFGRDEDRHDLCTWTATRNGASPLFSLSIA